MTVQTKLEVSTQRLKAAVERSEGKPLVIVFTADVQQMLDEIARLKDQVYDLLSLRHGSLDARVVKCNEATGQESD